MSYLRTHPELLASYRSSEPAVYRPALIVVHREYHPPLDHIVMNGYTLRGSGLRIPGIRNRSDRTDICQETLARAFELERRLAYDADHDFLPLLVGIARNVTVADHRHQDRERPAGGRESWAEGQIADIQVNDEPEDASQDPRLAIMRDFIASLPEPLRAFHEARHIQRMTRSAIEKRFGMTEWKVRALEDELRQEIYARCKRAGLVGGNHG